jgi:hypothetical protein
MHYHTDGFSLDEFNTKSGYDDPPSPHRIVARFWLLPALTDALYSSRPTLMPRCEQIACRRSVRPSPSRRGGGDGGMGGWRDQRLIADSRDDILW